MVVTNALLCATVLSEMLAGPYGDGFGQSGSRADSLTAAILLGACTVIGFICASEYACTFIHSAVGISAIYATSILSVAALWGVPGHINPSAYSNATDFDAFLLRAGTSKSHLAMLYLILVLSWYLSVMKVKNRLSKKYRLELL